MNTKFHRPQFWKLESSRPRHRQIQHLLRACSLLPRWCLLACLQAVERVEGYTLMIKEDQKVPQPFVRMLISLMRVFVIISQRATPLKTITLGIRFKHMNFGRMQTFRP
jgi:hypothetical protein